MRALQPSLGLHSDGRYPFPNGHDMGGVILHSLEKMESELNSDSGLAKDVAAVREAVYAAST